MEKSELKAIILECLHENAFLSNTDDSSVLNLSPRNTIEDNSMKYELTWFDPTGIDLAKNLSKAIKTKTFSEKDNLGAIEYTKIVADLPRSITDFKDIPIQKLLQTEYINVPLKLVRLSDNSAVFDSNWDLNKLTTFFSDITKDTRPVRKVRVGEQIKPQREGLLILGPSKADAPRRLFTVCYEFINQQNQPLYGTKGSTSYSANSVDEALQKFDNRFKQWQALGEKNLQSSDTYEILYINSSYGKIAYHKDENYFKAK